MIAEPAGRPELPCSLAPHPSPNFERTKNDSLVLKVSLSANDRLPSSL